MLSIDQNVDRLLEAKRFFRFDSEYRRFTASHHCKGEVSREEFQALLDYVRDEFVRIGRSSAWPRDSGTCGRLRHLLHHAHRWSLPAWANHSIGKYVLTAIKRGELIVLPDNAELMTHLRSMRMLGRWRGGVCAAPKRAVMPSVTVTPSQLRKERAASGYVDGTTSRVKDIHERAGRVLRKPQGQVTRAELEGLLAELHELKASGDLSAQEERNLTALWMDVAARGSSEKLFKPGEVVGSPYMGNAATGAMGFGGGASGGVKAGVRGAGPVFSGATASRGVYDLGLRQLESRAAISQTDLDTLAAQGVKFTPQNVIATGTTLSGQIVFLEKGNSRAGLQHIIDNHASDFANIGVSEKQIPSVVMRAVTTGNIIGYQGSRAGRPIYRTTNNDQSQDIAVTIGSNGYIVGANPAGSRK